MSKRLIDSSILTSSDFIDLGLKERWLWLGLCLICDDYGWVNADIGYLKNRIAPSVRMSRAHIERSLDTFSERSMIVCYTFGELKALCLLNFNYFNKLKRRRRSKYRELHEEKRRERKDPAFSVQETPSPESEAFMEKIRDGSAFRTEEEAREG